MVSIIQRHVPRKQGGRGLMQLEAAHAVEITKLVEYVDRKEDALIKVVWTHQHNTESAVLVIAKRISTHLEEQSLLPAEQKGCHPGSKHCKDQLMISKAIYEDCRRRNKNLSIVWIDYQKAFDSVPHSWVEKSIALVGVTVKLLDFVNYLWRNGTQGFF